MFYIIRTLRNHTKLIARTGLDSAQAALALTEMTARGMSVKAYNFSSDSEARMFIDPACAYFRKEVEALSA